MKKQNLSSIVPSEPWFRGQASLRAQFFSIFDKTYQHRNPFVEVSVPKTHPHCHAKNFKGVDDKDGNSFWHKIMVESATEDLLGLDDDAFLNWVYNLDDFSNKIAFCIAIRVFCQEGHKQVKGNHITVQTAISRTIEANKYVCQNSDIRCLLVKYSCGHHKQSDSGAQRCLLTL